TEVLGRLLDQLHTTRTRPVCLDVLNSAAARSIAREAGINLPQAEWVIVVGFEDNGDAVRWQVRQLLQEIAPADIQGVEARAGAASQALWRTLAEFIAPPTATLTFKANLLPQAVASFCQLAAELSESIRLHAHAGSGIVRGHLGGDLTLERVAAMLKDLTE